MFFERPAWLALLLLAAPWIWWLRRRRPRPFAVGGLEPFRPFAERDGARRRWSGRLVAALAALLCASFALARPRLGAAPEYLLRDRSDSVRATGLQAPAARGRLALDFESDPLPLLLQLPAGARAEVWTDLPEPAGLPARIRWNRADFLPHSGPNAALLGARPLGGGRWAVHALVEPGVGAVLLASDAGDRIPLAVGESLAELDLSPQARALRMVRPDGGEPDRRADHHWSLEPGSWTIPRGWDARWEAAVEAGRPGHRLVRADAPASPPFAADPFAELAELDAVARIAQSLRAEADRRQPPRSASECRTPPEPARWPADAEPPPAPQGPLPRWLGAIGFLCLALALFPRVLRWPRARELPRA